jgi:uncharacterized protein (DUF305 family)
MLTKKLLAAIGAAGLVATLAIAQEKGDHAKMGHDMMTMGTPKGDQGPSSLAFAKANSAMHTAMDIEFSGNADVDFAKGMIAHHEGAIAMSNVVLEYGKDPEMRKLATAIIAAQGPEIDEMKAWLAKQ